MKSEILVALILKAAEVEWPTVATSEHPGSVAYRQGVATMAESYVAVGSEGAIVSSEVDPLILATMGYEESRHRPTVKDGDCYQTNGMTKPLCRALGPMQVSRATPSILGTIDPAWKGLKVDELRDPLTSVKVSYRLLKYWKDTCKSKSLDALLGNWSAGKCLKGTIDMGARRCAFAKSMAGVVGVEFGATCVRPTRDKHVKRLIASIEKKNEEKKPESP